MHAYTRDGTPAYFQPTKKGGTRETNLGDLKKSGGLLVPSVSEIEKVIAAQSLGEWKVRQGVEATLRLLSRITQSDDRHLSDTIHMPDEEFVLACIEESEKGAKEAAKKGSQLHNALECWYTGAVVPDEWKPHCEAVSDAIRAKFGPLPWVAEKSFAHPLGFGGKVDLSCAVTDEEIFRKGNESITLTAHAIGDFKSKPKIEDGKKYAYGDKARQLAAYAYGLGMPDATCFNVFVGLEDRKVLLHVWEPAEIERARRQFFSALKLWKDLNDYDPSWKE